MRQSYEWMQLDVTVLQVPGLPDGKDASVPVLACLDQPRTAFQYRFDRHCSGWLTID